MKIRHLRSLLFCSLLVACATTPEPEQKEMPTAEPVGTSADTGVKVHPIHHSALVLEWANYSFYVDPHGGVERFKGQPPPDVILITDIHGDHLDTATLRALDLSKARLIAPPAVIELLPPSLRQLADTMRNGDRTEVIGIQVEAVPMYNMPDPNDPRHPKGRGNGYVLTMGGERIYISGDTEDIPEMRSLKDIDIAFVCMNLPYTMTVEQAASGVLAFKPKIVYPYHFRGKDGFSDVEEFKRLVNAGDPNIEVRIAEWY